MKKICSLLFITIFSFSFSQIHFGIKGGYNLSNMTMDWQQYGKEKFDAKSYFYAGGFIEFKITDKFSIQEEVIYTELGGKQPFDSYIETGNGIVYDGTNEATYHFPQIQNSVLAKYYPIKKLAVLGGINLGFNINPSLKFERTDFFYESGDFEHYNKVNLFPFVGTEFHITEKLFADARYNFGVTKMFDSSLDTKIGFFQIGLGYRFK